MNAETTQTSAELPAELMTAADETIRQLKQKTYGHADSNNLEGDFGTWAEWRDELVRFAAEQMTPIRADLAQSEAGAAALREALVDLVNWARRFETEPQGVGLAAVEQRLAMARQMAEGVLGANDAGRALLERLEGAEEELRQEIESAERFAASIKDVNDLQSHCLREAAWLRELARLREIVRGYQEAEQMGPSPAADTGWIHVPLGRHPDSPPSSAEKVGRGSSPCLNPYAMHGAADEFGGEDYPSEYAPSVRDQ